MKNKTGLWQGPSSRHSGAQPVLARVAMVAKDGPSAVPLGPIALRAALSVCVAIGFLWLLAELWADIDRAALAAAFARIAWSQWGLALLFTAISFWAVGRYDLVIHRHFATKAPPRLARNAGICAIAVSQTLGLGLISGAVLRWRMLPGFSLWQATRLTAIVALSFLAGWAVVTSATLLALPQAPWRGWAALVLGMLLALAGLSVWGPRWHVARWRWPNAFTLASLVALCATDTFAAALAFQALAPDTGTLPYMLLLPAFLLALGAGLALGTPGGVGPFEVTLIALLPTAVEADLVATVLAWRLVYHALPAILGAALALRGPGVPLPMPRSMPKPAYDPTPAVHLAEAGLRHQGQLDLIPVQGGTWLAGRRGHTLIALFTPFAAKTAAQFDAALHDLADTARQEGRMAVLYKASARLAARARTQGHAVRRTAWEAWLTPQNYRLSDPRRAGLRRKLRQAAAAGVTVRSCPAKEAPWRELDQIAAHWAAAHGRERGFSMGRHDRRYLAHQKIYIAWQLDRPIAYASFHHQPSEWTLDLMRHEVGVPDGTMHSLLQAAIDDAAKADVPRLSLAAVPEGAVTPPDFVGRLIGALAPQTAATGLYRFKSAFAPHWKPLYMACPSRAGFPLAGMSLWRAITRPGPITREIEQNHAEYGFASDPDPWHIGPDSR